MRVLPFLRSLFRISDFGFRIPALLPALFLAATLLPALAQPRGYFKDFLVPEYDAQKRKRAVLIGKEATESGEGVWQVKQLKIESYNASNQVAWVVEAPECLFAMQSKVATGSGPLTARSVDGQFAITGRGFEWRQAQQRLVISNEVRTLIHRASATNQSVAALTNAIAGLGRIDLEITASELVYAGQENVAIYRHPVQARELVAPGATNAPMTLSCGLAAIHFATNSSSIHYLQAETNVVFVQGGNRASGERAVYTASNELIRLTGQARWENAQAEGSGDALMLDRKQDLFITEGHSFTRLKPAPGARGATNEAIEVAADRMQARLPSGARSGAEILAQGNLVVTRGAQRATGARLVYSGTATNGQALLTGEPRWSAPDATGGADTLIFDRERNSFAGQGNGWIRAQRGAAQPGQPAPVLEAHADRYEYRGDAATLTGHVRAEDPQWKLACGEMLLRNAPGTNRLEQVLARQGVTIEQAAVAKGQVPWRLNARQARMDMAPAGAQMSCIVAEEQIVIEPARAALAGEQGLPWRLHCDRLTLALAGEAGRLDNVVAENHIRIEQTGAAGAGAEFPWKLDCDRLTLFMAANRTNQVDRVLAEQNVALEQVGGERRNGWWKLTSARALLRFNADQQVSEAEAEQQVRAIQYAANGLMAWTLTSERAALKLGASNRVERVTASNKVLLEQGLATNGLPVKLRCESAAVDLGASNSVQRIAARQQVVFEQGDSRATGAAGDYDALTGDVQLTGKPQLIYVEDPAKVPAGQAPRQIQVDNADVLIWNRLSNHFKGRGPYLIKPKGPIKPLKP